MNPRQSRLLVGLLAILLVPAVASAAGKPYFWREVPTEYTPLDSVLFGKAPDRLASLKAHNYAGPEPTLDHVVRQGVYRITLDPAEKPGPYMLLLACTDYYTSYSADYQPHGKILVNLRKKKDEPWKPLKPVFVDTFSRWKGYRLPGKGPFEFQFSGSKGWSIREAHLIQRPKPKAPKGPQWLRDNITYSYSVEPNRSELSKDLERTFLTDGILGYFNVAAFWRTHTSPKVTFDLHGRCLIDRVQIYARAGNGCGLPTVILEAEDDGDFHVIGRNDQGPIAGKYAPKGYKGYVEIADLNRPARRLRLSLPADRLWIQEVRIFGTRLPNPPFHGLAGAQAPEAKSYRLPAAKPKLRIAKRDYNRDGSHDVLLENRYVRVVIEPKRGGVIGSFIYKPTGRDLTTPPGPRFTGGLLADHLWSASSSDYDGDYYKAPYSFEIRKKRDRVGVTLARIGASGFKQYVRFEKTFWLTPNSAALRADYEIHCDLKAQTALTYGAWFHNFLGAPQGEPVRFFYPLIDGVRNTMPKKDSEDWLFQPARGWAGAVIGTEGTGVALVTDYRYLRNFHSWGYAGTPFPTLEWRTHKVRIPASESWTTTLWIAPFSGLGAMTGASEHAAGLMIVEKEKERFRAVVRVAAVRPLKATLVFETIHLPDGQWKRLSGRDIAIEPQKPVRVVSPSFSPEPGSNVVRVRLVDDAGRLLLTFEKLIEIKEATARYALLPLHNQIKLGKTPVHKPNLEYTSREIVTPHVKWGTPFAGKRVKALILLHGPQQREVVELAQRMDLDASAPFFRHWYPAECLGDYYGVLTLNMMKANLKESLNGKYDVYVISGIMWQELDEGDRKTILAAVKAGAGLIAIEPTVDKKDAKEASAWWKDLPFSKLETLGSTAYSIISRMAPAKPGHPLAVGLPYAALPPMPHGRYTPAGDVIVRAGDNPLLVTKTLGKGRMIGLSYRVRGHLKRTKVAMLVPYMNLVLRDGSYSLKPYLDMQVREGDYAYPYWEYHLAWLAKCFIWASAQDMPVKLVSLSATRETIAQSRLSEQAIVLQLKRAGYRGDVKAALTFMDRFGRRTKTLIKDVAWQGTEGAARFPLPWRPGGMNLADVIVRAADGKVLNWGSTAFDVTPAAKVAEITGDKDSYTRSDTARVTVKTSGNAADTRLEIRFVDGFDRVIQRTGHAPGQETAALPLKDILTIGFTARAVLRDPDGRIVHESRKDFVVAMPREWDDVASHVWDSYIGDGLPDFITRQRVAIWKELGFDSFHYRSPNGVAPVFKAVRRNDVRFMTSGGGIGRAQNADISSPEYFAYMKPYPENAAKHTGRKYGALVIIGGDENSYGPGDYKKKPHMVSGFRNWLKKGYKTIDALNQQWETAHKTWDEIVPADRKSWTNKSNFAPLSDLYTWNEIEYAAITRFQMDTVHEFSPGTRFAISGTQAPGPGSHDWWRLRDALDAALAYGGPQSRQRLSFCDWPSIAYTGQGSVGDAARHNIWDKLFVGNVGVAVCGANQFINPDSTIFRGRKAMTEEVLALKRGMGKIMLHAERTADPIALHYSQRSVHAVSLSGFHYAMNRGWADWERLTQELGFDLRYVSYDQIPSGELTTRGYKVLILPYSFAVSAAEAAKIREWVRAGGVLIGNLGAGAMDGHCRVLPTAGLDDVFGITRGAFDVAKRDCHVVGLKDYEGIRLEGARILSPFMEQNIQPAAGAEVIGNIEETGTPGVIVNRFGRGMAVYCAADIVGIYSIKRGVRHLDRIGSVIQAQENFIGSILALAGVTARTAVEDAKGNRIPFFETVRWRLGGHDYLGFLRNYSSARHGGDRNLEATFRLGRTGFISEMRSGRRFGRTDRVTYPIGPFSAQVFAVLPYEVAGVGVATARAVRQGDALNARLTVKTTGQTTPGTHVLRVELTDPDGKIAGHYSANLIAEKGVVDYVRPLALNETPGTWTLSVRDAATAILGKAEFIVKAAE